MEKLLALGVGTPGQRILDVGTGTGLFALEFASAGCLVTGLDPSDALLEKARTAARRDGLNAQFVSGRAEATGLAESSFDVVTAATCWHWFDKREAAGEAMRVLKPGGKLVIAVLEWHFLPGNVPTGTLELIRRLAPATSRPNPSTFRYPDWTNELISAGFNQWEFFGYIAPLFYTHEGWRGRVRASQGVGPVMAPEVLRQFDDEMMEMLRRTCPTEPMPVEHRISALVAWKA
ncbi:MAG TPA: methyltransferase domain-containing protein [Rhizomicrobium sp.]